MSDSRALSSCTAATSDGNCSLKRKKTPWGSGEVAREAEEKECCNIVKQFESEKSAHCECILSFGIRLFRDTLRSPATSLPPTITKASPLTNFLLIQKCRTLMMSHVSPLFLVHTIIVILLSLLNEGIDLYFMIYREDVLRTDFHFRHQLYGGMDHVTNT